MGVGASSARARRHMLVLVQSSFCGVLTIGAMLLSRLQNRALGQTRLLRHVEILESLRWGAEIGVLHDLLETLNGRSAQLQVPRR